MRKNIYICDRCGKEVPREVLEEVVFHHHKSFCPSRISGNGEVCEECLQDFIALAESFFDELNKEVSDGKAEAD